MATASTPRSCSAISSWTGGSSGARTLRAGDGVQRAPMCGARAASCGGCGCAAQVLCVCGSGLTPQRSPLVSCVSHPLKTRRSQGPEQGAERLGAGGRQRRRRRVLRQVRCRGGDGGGGSSLPGRPGKAIAWLVHSLSPLAHAPPPRLPARPHALPPGRPAPRPAASSTCSAPRQCLPRCTASSGRAVALSSRSATACSTTRPSRPGGTPAAMRAASSSSSEGAY